MALISLSEHRIALARQRLKGRIEGEIKARKEFLETLKQIDLHLEIDHKVSCIVIKETIKELEEKK